MTEEERARDYWTESLGHTNPLALRIIIRQAARFFAAQISASEAMGGTPSDLEHAL